MIPLIKREIVDNRHWVSMKEFMEIIAVGQTAPGAVAVNTATFVGYRMARYKGAIAAILGVSLPSFLVILAVAIFLLHFFNIPLFAAFFKGAAGAIVALLAQVSFIFSKEIFIERLSIILTGVALVDFYRKTEYYSNRCSFSGSFMAKIAPSTCYSHL